MQKWRRLQLRIESAQREVAQAVQPGLLDLLPLGPEHGLPLIGKLRLLRHHVFDRESPWRALLFARVRQAQQHVEASAAVVQVRRHQCLLELSVARELLATPHHREPSLQALQRRIRSDLRSEHRKNRPAAPCFGAQH